MSLAANIRRLRKKAGLTQIDLANKLGVSIATLRRWEAGETTPTGTKIFDLAEHLGTSPDSIVAQNNQASSVHIVNPTHKIVNNDLRPGMLVFDEGGTRIELPSTDRGYEIFNKLVDNFIRKEKVYS